MKVVPVWKDQIVLIELVLTEGKIPLWISYVCQNVIRHHSFPCSLSVPCPFALIHLGYHISHFISSMVEESETMLTSFEMNDTLEPRKTDGKQSYFISLGEIGVKELVFAK